MTPTIAPQEEEHFRDRVLRFRGHWAAGPPGPLRRGYFETWLPPAADPLRRRLLQELIAVDLVARLTRGERVSLQDYVAVCSELGSVDQLPIELLLIEFAAANRARLPITADRYASQYPAQANAFLAKLRAGDDADLRAFFGELEGWLNIVRGVTVEGDATATLPDVFGVQPAAEADVAGTAVFGTGPGDAVPVEVSPGEAGSVEAGSVDAGPVEASSVEAGSIEAGSIEANASSAVGTGRIGTGRVDATLQPPGVAAKPEQPSSSSVSQSGSAPGTIGPGDVSASASGRLVNIEGGYRTVREIGRGNFGEVWLCEAPGGVEVALKLVRIPPGQRLQHVEVRSLDLMKRLRHPFLMQVQAFWVSESQVVIAMELADHSLRERAADCEGSRLPLRELLQYLAEASEGIDYLHREHVVHRDIKPENLLLLKGHIKVADFGLARFIDDSGLSREATQVAGSPLYMAPEVWEGRPEAASDQYSLAITYLEMRLGRSPLASKSVVAVMREHLGGQINLDGIPAPEQAVLRRALSINPARRYATCLQFSQELAKAAAPAERARSGRGPLWAAAAVGAAVIAGSVAAAVAWRSSPEAADVRFHGSLKLQVGSAAERIFTPVGAASSVASVQAVEPPRGLTLAFDADQSVLRLSADLNAPLGMQTVKLRMETADAVLAKDLQVELVESDRLKVPTGKLPAAGARRVAVDGMVYYDRLEHPLPGGGVEFVLVPPEGGDDFRTFYASKLEVSNRLFAEYARVHPEQFQSDAEQLWRRGALAGYDYLGVEGPQADLPVVFVNADQAHHFAQWLGGLLPTKEQWDAAAGRRHSQEGPFVGPYVPGETDICINRMVEGPAAVGSSQDDVSPLGIRDLAGSVRELTRDLLFSDQQKVPVQDPSPSMEVIVRGNGYIDDVPWNYSDAATEIPAAIPYRETQPGDEDHVVSDVGFRMVLEL